MKLFEAYHDPIVALGTKGPGKFQLQAEFYRLSDFVRVFSEQEDFEVPTMPSTWREFMVLMDTLNRTGRTGVSIDWEHGDVELDGMVASEVSEDSVIEIVANQSWMSVNSYSSWTHLNEYLMGLVNHEVAEDSVESAAASFEKSPHWVVIDEYARHPNELLISQVINRGGLPGAGSIGTEQHLFVDLRQMSI